MKIVVIGGTGLIGSKTVAILRQGGHNVFAASPTIGSLTKRCLGCRLFRYGVNRALGRRDGMAYPLAESRWFRRGAEAGALEACNRLIGSFQH